MGRPRKGVTPWDRVFSLVSVDAETGCWVWHGYRMPAGHGRVRVDGKKVLVHVWVWGQFVGPVPEGLELDHLCRNPPCCNPEHLEPVTHRVNVLRGEAPAAAHARKTHCPRNHPYDEQNTRIYRGSRYCIACQRERWVA